MKIYRNVYIKAGFPRLNGKELIYYSGKVVTNADVNGSVKKEFDRTKDIYLGCDCDAPKYSTIIKKNVSGINQENSKRANYSYGKTKCTIC